MRKNISLSMPEACSEKWNNFTPASNGGFCSSCSKIVVDFTKMSDDEISDFFNNKPAHTCGRFRPDQLKVYSFKEPLKINPGFALLKASILSLLFILISKPTFAQNTIGKPKIEVVDQPGQPVNKKRTGETTHVLKGVVISEDKEPLAGANIFLKGSRIGVAADVDGRFEFPERVREGDVIVFAFIGFETKEFVIPNTPSETLEIRMACNYDIMGEVNVNTVYMGKQPAIYRMWSKVKELF